MQVRVSSMKPQNRENRHGWKVDFELNKRYKTATIYQNVHVWLKTVNDKEEEDSRNYSFTEAWEYNAKKKKKITDSFLVPVDWRKNQKGCMIVKSVVWANGEKMNPKLKQGTDADYWGNLHGSFDKITPTSETTERTVKIEWDNVGKLAKKTFTKGKDLSLVENTVANGRIFEAVARRLRGEHRGQLKSALP